MELKQMIIMLVVAAFVGGGLGTIASLLAERSPNSWLVAVLPILAVGIEAAAVVYFWIWWWGGGHTMTFYNTVIQHAPAEHHDFFSPKSIFWTVVYSCMYVTIGNSVTMAIWHLPVVAFRSLFGRNKKG